MSAGPILALFAVAFLLWALTLAMIWQAFRSWQYLVDLSHAQTGFSADAGPTSWEELPRDQTMGLRAHIVLSGLPEGSSDEMAPYGRRFRRAVLGTISLAVGVSVLVTVLEPALWGAVRIFLIGFGLWLGAHLMMLGRWRNRKAAL